MFEKEASLKKAIEYIYVSAKNNAELIVFPELFVQEKLWYDQFDRITYDDYIKFLKTRNIYEEE